MKSYITFITIFLLITSCGVLERELVYPELAWDSIYDKSSNDVEEDMLKKNFYLIFDASASMNRLDKMQTAKNAVTNFINMIPADANIGLTVFDRKAISERAALGTASSAVNDEIMNIKPGGSTPLYSSIRIGYTKLLEQAHRQMGYGEYNLIIVTDGEASKGEDPRELINDILYTSPVIIHTIGFQIDETHSLNQPGRIYYKAANNYEELSSGLQSVLAELQDFTVSDFSD